MDGLKSIPCDVPSCPVPTDPSTITTYRREVPPTNKLMAALSTAVDMLAEKGIIVTELEMRVLIEAAVAEFNEAFKKEAINEPTEGDTESE